MNPIKDSTTGVLKLNGTSSEAWELAKDVVNYPVHIVPMFFDAAHVYESMQGQNGVEYKLAKGQTNTDREVQFFGVAVDKNREDIFSIISTVTGQYSTLKTAQVYADLQEDLEKLGMDSKPETVYVSGSGGSHRLVVKINDMVSPVTSIGEIDMAIRLETSLDGSKKHSVILSLLDKEGVQISGVSSSYTMAAKHTKSIGERHVAFSVILEKMLEEWNTSIAPMLQFLDGETFDKEAAVKILCELMEEASIPDKHITSATSNIEKDDSHTALSLLSGLSHYIEETCSTRPERLSTFRANIDKHAMKVLKKWLPEENS